MDKGRVVTEKADTVKTSIKLPRKLWREAHIRAMDDDLEFQELVTKALDAYLKGKGGAP